MNISKRSMTLVKSSVAEQLDIEICHLTSLLQFVNYVSRAYEKKIKAL